MERLEKVASANRMDTAGGMVVTIPVSKTANDCGSFGSSAPLLIKEDGRTAVVSKEQG